MATKPEPGQSGLGEEDQSEGSTREKRKHEESSSGGEKNTGAACQDLGLSDKLDLIAGEEENVKKTDTKPGRRRRAAAKKETIPKPAVKKRRI